MTTTQKSQNAWVQDLNKSVSDIQRKERNVKYLRYFGLFAGCSILVLIVIVLGKSKLQVVNPKLEITETNVSDIVEEIAELPKEEERVSALVKTTNIKIESKKVLNSATNPENHLAKNRPKKSLNKENNETLNNSSKRHGKHIAYYDNGNKWVELNFENGLREGVQFTWHRNGKLKSELNYVSGKKHGIQKWWQKDGKILNEKIYINGEWQKN